MALARQNGGGEMGRGRNISKKTISTVNKNVVIKVDGKKLREKEIESFLLAAMRTVFVNNSGSQPFLYRHLYEISVRIH